MDRIKKRLDRVEAMWGLWVQGRYEDAVRHWGNSQLAPELTCEMCDAKKCSWLETTNLVGDCNGFKEKVEKKCEECKFSFDVVYEGGSRTNTYCRVIPLQPCSTNRIESLDQLYDVLRLAQLENPNNDCEKWERGDG